MRNKGTLFCIALILMGTLDWVTTVTGTIWFGAVEINPLFADLTQTNILLFSVVKLATVAFLGLLFYKANTIVNMAKNSSHLARRFLESGCTLSIMIFTVAVTNNIVTVAGII